MNQQYYLAQQNGRFFSVEVNPLNSFLWHKSCKHFEGVHLDSWGQLLEDGLLLLEWKNVSQLLCNSLEMAT